MRISVVLPTTQAWPEVAESLVTSVCQRISEPYEVLVVDGHGQGLDKEPSSPVRWIRAPGADVFRLRALGMAEARGELLVFTEDHCIADPDWLALTSAAHRATPALALIGPVRNHPESARTAVDRAAFALTLGAFAPPLGHVPAWRLPVPTNLSIKQEALTHVGRPPPGWIEYDFLAAMLQERSIDIAGTATLSHRQSWHPLGAIAVQFQSGRSYGASLRGWPGTKRRAWWRALPAVPRALYRRSCRALPECGAGQGTSRVDRLWLMGLILANVAGQAAGALLGEGASRLWLR